MPMALTGAGIPAPFTPASLAGLVLWLPADGTYESTAGGGGGSAAAGASVGRWIDASGQANHADAPDAAGRPTRAADGRGVKGNDSSHTLLTPSTTLPAYGTAGWSYFFKWKRASAASDSRAIVAYRTAADYRFGNFGTGGAGAYFDSVVRDVAPADTEENVVGIVAETTGGGTLYESDGTTSAFVFYPDTVAIGLSLLSHNNAADGQFSNDTLIEIAAYSRALTGTESQRVLTYLAGV